MPAKPNPKILHVIPSVSPKRGGPSKAIIEMVSALRDIGVDAEIATTNDDGVGELEVDLNYLINFQGVPVRFFKRFSPKIGPVREFAFSNDFRKWLKQNIHQYSTIHVHAIFSFTSSYTMYLARLRGIDYVLRPIGQLEKWSLTQSKVRKQIFLMLFEKSNIFAAKNIHCTALSEREQLLNVFPKIKHDTPKVIPLGITTTDTVKDARARLAKQYSVNENKKILLFLSRIHEKKGLEQLLEGLSQVDAQRWHLLIAGIGEETYIASLNQKIKDINLQDHCQFTGFAQGHTKQLMLQGADLFVLTSFSENFGIAVLEALSAGTAALVSRPVALSREIEQHNLGYVCDVNSDSIADALTRAFEDSSNPGARAQPFVEQNYNWRSIAESINNRFYQS